MVRCRWLDKLKAVTRPLIVAVLALDLIIAMATSASADAVFHPRIALLIANGHYSSAGTAVLPAAKDARLLRDELVRAQFDTILQDDANTRAMQAAVEAFKARITPGTIALFYFIGFGIQVDRRTYLIPTDAQIVSEEDVKRFGVDIDALLGDMDQRGAQVKIAILDASRRNPFERRFRKVFAGIAGLNTPGTLALFSASPEQTSPDDTADTSPFMEGLVKEVRSPGISAEEVFARTRFDVSRASNREQIPWMVTSIVDDFAFGEVRDETSAAQSPVIPMVQPSVADTVSAPSTSLPKLVSKPKQPEPLPLPQSADRTSVAPVSQPSALTTESPPAADTALAAPITLPELVSEPLPSELSPLADETSVTPVSQPPVVAIELPPGLDTVITTQLLALGQSRPEPLPLPDKTSVTPLSQPPTVVIKPSPSPLPPFASKPQLPESLPLPPPADRKSLVFQPPATAIPIADTGPPRHRRSTVDVPTMVGGDLNIEACGSTGTVRGLNPHGDGFLSVRSGPGGRPFRELGRLLNGQIVKICEERSPWASVVYLPGLIPSGCGVNESIRTRTPYRGPCRSGWVFLNYVATTSKYIASAGQRKP